MYRRCPEHPELAAALYGEANRPGPRCGGCGAALGGEEAVYSWETGRCSIWLCADCFDAAFSELGRREKAGLVGSLCLTAREVEGVK